MKTKERAVDVADLDAIALLDEDQVIFIDNDEEELPTSLCVLANFSTRQFDEVKPMSDYLNLPVYRAFQDGDTQISYRKRIIQEMEPDAIAAMLKDFTQKHLLRKSSSSDT
jgi:hypothetical protein